MRTRKKEGLGRLLRTGMASTALLLGSEAVAQSNLKFEMLSIKEVGNKLVLRMNGAVQRYDANANRWVGDIYILGTSTNLTSTNWVQNGSFAFIVGFSTLTGSNGETFDGTSVITIPKPTQTTFYRLINWTESSQTLTATTK